tara:strand:- start:2372 stop:4558 length:2187 start_codon:yes stop_codon:yes gene_type:complete
MKIISKIFFTLLFLILIIVIYLSLFGIETKKFNNQIINKIKKIDKDLDIRLNTIKIIFDPIKFKINAKTIGPELISRNKSVEIENIKTRISLRALLDDQFSIENLEISTKSLEIKNLISFIRSINKEPELYILEKIVKKGFLISDIKLEFDTQGKIKNNYKIKGFIKDAKISLSKEYKVDKINLTFNLKENDLIVNDAKFILNELNFNSNKISIKDDQNYFFVKGEIDHQKFDLDNEELDNLLSPFIKNFSFKNLSFSSKNIFSFNLSKKFKLKDLEVVSKIKLAKLSILNNFNLRSFFPEVKDNISLSNNKLEIKYKKKNLSIIGEGKIKLQDKVDNVTYKLSKFGENIKFETFIKIKHNPLKINFLNYENSQGNETSINIEGTKKKDTQIIIDLFSIKEKENIFNIKNLNFNKDNQIIKFDLINLDFLDKKKQKNSISLIRKNKEYFLTGSNFNADNLINSFIDNNENQSKILNIDSKIDIKIDKVYLDKNTYLSNLRGNLNFKKQKISDGNLEGFFTEDNKLKLTINTNGDNKITTLFSDHAVPIVRRYKFIKGFDDGKIDFYSSTNGKESQSTLKIYNFKLKELPALTKVLTLASLQGIADILSGEGIRFDEFEMNFKNVNNLMKIEEIYAIGPAISVLMDGYVEKDKLISLRGTLVPATTINKFIGSIPVLGDILVGSKTGEGVFGVSFKIKGPPKKLETTVNPVKTLTPRFITRTLEKIKKN